MSDAASRPAQPEAFLRGCAWPPGAGMPYPRCEPGAGGQQLPADTRAAAAVPAGVRFEFLGEPRALAVDYRTETSELGYRGAGAGTDFALYRGDRRVDSAAAAIGAGSVTLSLGPGKEPATLYLPEGMRPTVFALRGVGGEIRPAPKRQRWLCYGDSIAEGWCASEPAGAWPHIVSRRSDLDVVNLGYAGAARGELQSAREIASLPADLITVAHGTNCWSRTPHSAAGFRIGLHAFLDSIRAGHPATPIVAISPLLRPDAEAKANALGASLSDLRAVFEDVVAERRARGDAALRLVAGLDLVGAAQLPDGIHPDDTGHRQIAEALASVLCESIAEGQKHA